MRYLLIDIGNSRIKAAESVNYTFRNFKSIKYRKSCIDDSLNLLLSIFNKEYSKITVSCPVKILVTDLKLFLKRRYKSSKILVINNRVKLPIKIIYKSKLGSDRLCAAIGAYHKYRGKNNILIIDYGTATTFNLLTGNRYKGGLIACGVKTQIKALHDYTTLPMAELRGKYSLICKETKHAISSASYYQTRFFCEGVINKLRLKYKDLYVIATGGFSEIFARDIKSINKADANLVLEGLNYLTMFSDDVQIN